MLDFLHKWGILNKDRKCTTEMWLNLRCRLFLKPTYEWNQCRLLFFARALHIAKTNDATVTIAVTIAQRSIMLSYPVIAGLLIHLNSEVQPTTAMVQSKYTILLCVLQVMIISISLFYCKRLI